MSESPTSFAWLIELCVPDGLVVAGGPRTPRGIYYAVQCRGLEDFTADACEAVRFARKEDAERIIPLISPTNRPGAAPVYEATEHGFYDMNVVAAPSKPEPCHPNCGHDHGPTLSRPEPEAERLIRCAANDIAYVFGTDVNVTSKIHSTIAIIKETLVALATTEQARCRHGLNAATCGYCAARSRFAMIFVADPTPQEPLPGTPMTEDQARARLKARIDAAVARSADHPVEKVETMEEHEAVQNFSTGEWCCGAHESEYAAHLSDCEFYPNEVGPCECEFLRDTLNPIVGRILLHGEGRMMVGDTSSSLPFLRQASHDLLALIHERESSFMRNLAERDATITALRAEVEELRRAVREVWPHLTGHCFEEPAPTCFGTMRDILSAVVSGLPYATEETTHHE